MLEQFVIKRFLYQNEAATHLLHLHDENLAYFDDNSNVPGDNYLERSASIILSGRRSGGGRA